MQSTSFIATVRERDIDLLLLEECHCNPAFQRWFTGLLFGNRHSWQTLLGAWHSLTTPGLGESDLVIVVEDTAGHKWAALIENKIDAPPQPRQAARYRERGQRGSAAGDWDTFKTCLVAPADYLETASNADRYDVQIAYEQIRDWLSQTAERSDRPERLRYKARVVEEAIAQNRRGYQMVIDRDVSRFWLAYWRFATAEFPRLKMKKPGNKPANAKWPEFRTGRQRTTAKLFHKLNKGAVELQLDGRADQVELLRERNQHLLPDNVQVVQVGGAAAFQVEVPEIDHTASFEEYEEEVAVALTAAVRLLDLLPQLQGIDR